MVNDAILSLGIQPEVCQQKDNPNLWKLHRGEAQIILVAQESTNHVSDKVATLSMMSPLVQLPEDYDRMEEVFIYLLGANHQLITESFSLSNRWIILSTTYFLEDLRRAEVVQLLDALSFHAQSFIKTFLEEFDLGTTLDQETA